MHSLPGRVRFRIPERRGDAAYFDEIQRRLANGGVVTVVDVSPLTGSVLVRHSGTTDDFINQTLRAELGDLVDLDSDPPSVARRLNAEVTALDRGVQDLTRGELDLNTLASLGLMALAGVQLVRGQHPVLAVSLCWYASELLRRSAASPESAAIRS